MNAILSIKPEFVTKIFSGEKRYEYRKTLFKQKIDTVYIYASRPISKIVGQFKIAGVISNTPEEVWKETKDYSGVSKEFFYKYFTGKDKGVALKIKDAQEFPVYIGVKDIKEKINVPQSFIYINFNISNGKEESRVKSESL